MFQRVFSYRQSAIRSGLFYLVCTAILIALGVTPGLSQTKIVHVNWTGYGQPFFEHLDAMAEEFQRQNPGVEVEILRFQNNSLEDLLVMIASGVQVDSFSVMPHWGLHMAVTRTAADLRPFIERDGFDIGGFLPGTIASFTYDDMIWGLPDSVIIQALGYNATMFDEAGLQTPDQLSESEWNWDTLLATAEKLTRDTSGDGQTDIFGYEFGGGNVRMIDFAPVVDQAGGLMFNRRVDPTEPRFTSEEVQMAADWVTNLFVRGISPSAQDGQVGWTAGRAGMVSYEQPRSPKYLGEMAPGAVISLGKHPMGPAANSMHLITRGMQVHSGSPNPEAAWRWIKFLTTDPVAQRSQIQQTGWIPPWADSLSVWSELAEVPDHQKAQVNPILGNSANRPRYLTRVPQIESIFAQHMNRAAAGEISVQEALIQLQHEAEVRLVEAHAQ